MKAFKWYHKFFILLIVLSFFIIHIFTSSDSQANVQIDYEKFVLLDYGWQSEGNAVTIPGNTGTKAGEWVSITRVLADVTDDMALCFRTDHTFVRVYVEDELIYSFGEQDNIPYGETPGSIWNIIDLREDYSRKNITIETMCPYDKYSGHFRDIIYGSRRDVMIYIYKNSIWLFTICIITLFIGILFIILTPFIYAYTKHISLLPIGLFLSVTAVWGFTESRFLQLFFADAYEIQMVNFITFALIPVASWAAIKEIGFYGVSKKYDWVFLIDALVFILVVVLQFFNIVDFFNTIGLIHLVIVVFGIMLFRDSLKVMKQSKDVVDKVLLLSAFLSTTFLSFLDIIEFYTWDKLGNGVLFRLGLIMLVALLGIWYIKQAFLIYASNVEKETLEKLAYTDALTGFKNRRAFEEDINLFSKMDQCVVVFADMNNLKKINDNMGHEYGDKALQLVAEGIRMLEKSFCYRFGGDEFCVVCTELDENEIENRCIEINDYLRENSKEYFASVSIAYGYDSFYRKKGIIFGDVVNNADERMYYKKLEMKQTRE